MPKYRLVLKVKYRLVLKVKYRLVLKVKYRLVLKISVKQGCTVYWIRDLLVCMISRTLWYIELSLYTYCNWYAPLPPPIVIWTSVFYF